MVFVSTSGYILSVIGPYYSDGKNNDAQILKHIIQNDIEEFKQWVCENDVIIVDRGFRDFQRLGWTAARNWRKNRNAFFCKKGWIPTPSRGKQHHSTHYEDSLDCRICQRPYILIEFFPTVKYRTLPIT